MNQLNSTGKRSRVRYEMLALVFVNVVINYLDRTNLAVAATSLSKELNLLSVQLGFILSAFGWTYAALQIPGGLIADRIRPRILYSICLVTGYHSTRPGERIRRLVCFPTGHRSV